MTAPASTETPDCERCNNTGSVALSSITLRYRGPGPVPDDARGVVEVDCHGCSRAGESR